MLCCLLGWVPPLRFSMLTSLHKPSLKHQCLQLNCNCAGNLFSPRQSWELAGITTKQKGSKGVWLYPMGIQTTEVNILLILLDPDNRKFPASKHQVDMTVFLTTPGKELPMGNLGTLL